MKCGLVLTRKESETVILETDNGRICITVTRILGDRVRIGFAAPDDVHIMRGELDRGGGHRFDEEFRVR